MNAFSRIALFSAVVGRGRRSTKKTTTQREKKETRRRFLRICVVAFIISLSLSECFVTEVTLSLFFQFGVAKEFPENKRALSSAGVKRGARLYDANEKKSKCRARFLSRRRRPR